MKNIVIIDYNMGNLSSVANALEFIGHKPIISNKKEDLEKADYIILPGVGAFGKGMENLEKLNLIEILHEQIIVKKKPFLGICIGMQLLAEEGEEGGLHKGLGWVKGTVKKLNPSNKKLKIPHIGWNDVSFKKDSPLLKELEKTQTFYFVNSYHLVPTEDITLGTSDYGGEFVTVIQKENIFATQFHPEKSHKAGLQILKNFIKC